jgi:hypothetical protein
VCLQLIVLWVRSYWHNVRLFQYHGAGPQGSFVHSECNSSSGKLAFALKRSPAQVSRLPEYEFAGFQTVNQSGRLAIQMPLWFPVLLTTVLAALPWCRWSKRFSLRTLLIATTLVALALGLVVYATSS